MSVTLIKPTDLPALPAGWTRTLPTPLTHRIGTVATLSYQGTPVVDLISEGESLCFTAYQADTATRLAPYGMPLAAMTLAAVTLATDAGLTLPTSLPTLPPLDADYQATQVDQAPKPARKTPAKSAKPRMWRTPTRRAFAPVGVTHGATVTGTGYPINADGTPTITVGYTEEITGQVWARAKRRNGDPVGSYWMIVDHTGQAWTCNESDLRVSGQCIVDTPLIPADDEAVAAWLAGHTTHQVAVETEHGLLIPA